MGFKYLIQQGIYFHLQCCVVCQSIHAPAECAPAMQLRFLRDHRLEWADNNIDAYPAAAIKMGPSTLLGPRVGNFGAQNFLHLFFWKVKMRCSRETGVSLAGCSHFLEST